MRYNKCDRENVSPLRRGVHRLVRKSAWIPFRSDKIPFSKGVYPLQKYPFRSKAKKKCLLHKPL